MKSENKNKGFTLIELIIVLMIMVIVSSVGTVGMLQYMDYSMYNKNEEYARTIFSTTQTALTNLKKNEGLEGLQRELENRLYNNSYVTDKEEWLDTKIYDADTEPRYYYLNSYYYTDENNASDKVTKPILRDLIGDYIYDNDIWNHALSVEIDPYDGVVRRVWYCAQTMEFTRTKSDIYDTHTDAVTGQKDNEKGLVCMYIGIGASPIDYETRRDMKIGLYSADAKIMPEDIAHLPNPAQNVMFDNGDRLILKWDIDPSETYDYIVELEDESGNKAEITIPNQTIVDLNGDASYTSRRVELKNGASAYFLMYRGGSDVEISLDAIDYSVEVQDDNTPENLGGEYTGSDVNHFTTSAMRFTLPAYGGLKISDKIKATVYATDGTNKSTPAEADTEEYLLFGTSGSKNNYTISNFRHLHNMRFAKKDDMGTSTYTITKSLDWNTSSKLVYDSTGSNDIPLNKDSVKYKPTVVWDDQTLDGHSSSGYITISNLVVGNYGETDIGLVKQNKGTIQNIILSDPTVRGGQHVGAFCGVNYGELKNLTTQITDPNNTDVGIISSSYVGGIVGSSREGNFTNLINNIPVKGNNFVGGIVGDAEDGNYDTCINNASVSVSEINASPSHFGGIAGKSNRIIFEDCESHCDSFVDSDENIKNLVNNIVNVNADGSYSFNPRQSSLMAIINMLKIDYAGGLVGEAIDSRISGCTIDTQYILGKRYVGGIAGRFSKASAENAEIKNMTNYAMVIGNECVGGITGVNGTINETNGFVDTNLSGEEKCRISNCVNKELVVSTGNFCGGITGFNNGVVKDCYTDNSAYTNTTNDGMYILTLLKHFGTAMRNAQYVGGVIGYNNFKFENSNADTIKNVPIVAGNNYVGGIVGRIASNNEDNAKKISKFSNFNISGGYIYGMQYTGGMIGSDEVKDNIAVAPNEKLICNPDYVSGAYDVGGFLGYDKYYSIKNINNLSLGNGKTVVDTTSAGGSGYAAGLVCVTNSNFTLKDSTVDIDSVLTSTSQGVSTGGLIGKYNGNGLTFDNDTVKINKIIGRFDVGGFIGLDTTNASYTFNNNVSLEVADRISGYGGSTGSFIGTTLSSANIDLSGFHFTGSVYAGGQLTNKTIGNR